jgi:hypothetical protein
MSWLFADETEDGIPWGSRSPSYVSQPYSSDQALPSPVPDPRASAADAVIQPSDIVREMRLVIGQCRRRASKSSGREDGVMMCGCGWEST